MSDEKPKDALRSTLNGSPSILEGLPSRSNPEKSVSLTEESSDGRIEESSDPRIEESSDPRVEESSDGRGVVIDVSSDVENREEIKPQRTDVRLLFKVFGDETSEGSDASNGGSELNSIVRQYDHRMQHPSHLQPSGPDVTQSDAHSFSPSTAQNEEDISPHDNPVPSFDLNFEEQPEEEEEEEITRPPRDIPPVYPSNAPSNEEPFHEDAPPDVRTLQTGTVAFMPHQDLGEESSESLGVATKLNPQRFEVSRKHISLQEFPQNSEAVEIKDDQSPVTSDPSIPVDKSGRPLAKIYRRRGAERPRSGIFKTSGHLGTAGLYDQRSIKFNREEVTESKVTTSLGYHEPKIDIHLAAALEIAYSSDKKAAMRTSDLIASIINENPSQLEVLAKHFPGRLFVDPFTLPLEKLGKVSEHGPVVSAISKLQLLGVNFLTRFLRHEDRFRRFYAMMLIHEMMPQSAAKIIVDRLADDDPEIRVHASSILLQKRSQPTFDKQVLAPLREILGKESESRRRVRNAARFLALVLDTKAVPLAIRLVNEHHDDDRYNCALELLRTVTLQRFQSPYEWNEWAKGRSFSGPMTRLFWLVDALNDPNISVREEAYQQLRPTFGHLLRDYLPSLPEPARRRTQNFLKIQFQKA